MTSGRENTDPQRGCNKRPGLLGSLSASVSLTLFPPTNLGHFFPPCNWNSLLDHCTKWPLLVFSAPLQRKSYKMSFNFKFPGMSQIDPVGDVIFGPFGQPGRFMLQEYGFYNIWNGDCDGFKTRKSFCGPPSSGVWSPIIFWHFVVFFWPRVSQHTSKLVSNTLCSPSWSYTWELPDFISHLYSYKHIPPCPAMTAFAWSFYYYIS